MNPADLGTRDLTINQILDSTWLHGPTLIKIEEKWLKNFKIKETCSQVTSIEPLAVWHRLSNLKRLQNAIAFCIRAKEKDKSKNLMIIAEEKMKATKAIFRSVQQESFKKDKQTHLHKLNPFLDVD